MLSPRLIQGTNSFTSSLLRIPRDQVCRLLLHIMTRVMANFPTDKLQDVAPSKSQLPTVWWWLGQTLGQQLLLGSCLLFYKTVSRLRTFLF